MKFLNNVKILWIIIVVLLVLNVLSIGTIWVREWDDVRPRFRDPVPSVERDHFLKRELNFSEEQQIQFDSLLNAHREELQQKVNEIRTLREELMSMMRNQEFTADSEDLVRRIGEKQSELELLNYNHFKEVMGICNNEQKQVFLETLKRAVGPHFRDRGHDDRDDMRRGRRRGDGGR